MNRNFKRILTLVLATLLVLPVFAGCGSGNGGEAYTRPWAIMESATFTKPAMLAPAT